MINLYDIAYSVGLWGSSPYWLIKPSARRKVSRALKERMGHVQTRDSQTPAVWIHAVSLGEINATRALIDELRKARPDLHFIVSTTTQTGFDRGQQLYGNAEHVKLIRYPLDFTPAVTRTLDALRPSVVVLMELEIWPNFVYQCARRNIPVLIANGRITRPSYEKYMWIKPVTARMLQRVARVCVQVDTYASLFLDMGAHPRAVEITGTMKFDTAQIADRVEGDAELAKLVGLRPGREFILVCGSTGPGEEDLILAQYHELLARYGRMRLAIIPRHPERFDEVADLILQHNFNVVRRSQVTQPVDADDPVPPVILGDTMGELRKFYSLADVVFVGRSLVDLGPRQHGSDMIEPAALAKPVIVGPYTANFAEAVRRFRESEAILEVDDAETFRQAIAVLHSTPAEAKAMGQRAQDVVRREKGATMRHAQEILALLDQRRD
jgi:3-deoxy-D-manno-octulosonic-acid transferase